MENTGALCLLLAICIAPYAVIASAVGAMKRNRLLVLSAERAVYGVCFCVSVASAILVYAFLTDDYRFAYVASNSNHALSPSYKFAAWWGGQEGSLLLWSWLLATYSAVVVFLNRRKLRDMMPYVTAILMVTQSFFLILNVFVASPFRMLAKDGSLTAVLDGNGLNPLLQYPMMRIHPPILYLGYVGMVVPFAFAMASLIRKQKGDAWIHTTRRWSLVTWLFQGVGVLMGAFWAYAALGWGGYWNWDPVENSSLLPWLSSTAFLHSVMMQEKKGMMKVWNATLISASFFLCILGTDLTRSGVVSSVHAFAQSPIGKYFTSFLAIGIAATAYLILQRLEYLKSEAQLESVVSRESSFLFNNLILLASCFAVLWGTLFPIISEAVSGEKISLDAPWFNRLMVPIGLFLLFLTGVGPLFAWRRTSTESLRRNFLWPGVASCSLVTVLFVVGIRDFYPLISFGFCLFVALTVFAEFYRGARAIASKSQINFAAAIVELTHRNTRRYGGYLVHIAIVLIFIGCTGAAFNKDLTTDVKVGQSVEVGNYELRVKEIKDGDNENVIWQSAVIDVRKNGEFLQTLEPRRELYKASRQQVGQGAIRRRLNEDLYLNFALMRDGKITIQAYVFPLVCWIWTGGFVLILGTLIALVPSKMKLEYAGTELVGITKKHVQVEQ